jgi:hypothetical protein
VNKLLAEIDAKQAEMNAKFDKRRDSLKAYREKLNMKTDDVTTKTAAVFATA